MPAPSLLLLYPDHWEPEPEGMKRLRLHLSDEYGATLEVRPFNNPRHLSVCGGFWERPIDIEVEDLIVDAFFTLEWMGEVL